MRKNITLQCNICNHVWVKEARYAYGCPQCDNERKNKANTHDDYLRKLQERNITGIIPIEEYIQANEKILHKCQKCGYEWCAKPNNILSGFGCPACCGHITILGKNDLWTTNPNVAKLLLNTDDGYLYSKCSDIKVDWVYPDCGSVIKKRMISNITRQGLRCDKCSDGISVPNKIALNILDQLQINFETEYCPDWIKPRRYDFYFRNNEKEYILEMDGDFHTTDNKMSGQSADKSKQIDNYKDKVAREHGVEVIRIECKKSDLEYIKEKILHSKLALLFNLSNIDWTICFEKSFKSNVITAIDLWNQKYVSSEIADILHLSTNTICSYLNKGNKLGLCEYLGFENRFKKVICLNTGEVFDLLKNASEYCGLNGSAHIIDCCKGKRKYSGKHPITNQKLQWQYYDEYLKSKALSEIESA